MPIVTRTQLKKFIGQRFAHHRQIACSELVTRIETYLELETFHFHRRGKLLLTLDEVIRAILAGELDEETVPVVTDEQITAARQPRAPGKFYPRRPKEKPATIEYITVPKWMVE